MNRLSVAKKSVRGFSLLELLLVVAVGAVLILAGLGAYRLVSENSNTNTAITQLTTLKQQVQQSFAGQSSYGTANADLTATLDNLHALPSNMPLSGTNLRSAFSTNVTIVAQGSAFDITFNGVPKSACVKMGQLYTPANASDLVQLSINGTTKSATANNNFALAQLTADCANSTNTMVWRFQ